MDAQGLSLFKLFQQPGVVVAGVQVETVLPDVGNKSMALSFGKSWCWDIPVTSPEKQVGHLAPLRTIGKGAWVVESAFQGARIDLDIELIIKVGFHAAPG